MMNYKKYFLIIFASTFLTSCAGYSSKLECPNAKGLGCTMLREVDQKIDSGEIEEAYKDKKKCKRGICNNEQLFLKLKKKERADKYKDDNNEEIENNDNVIIF